MIPFREALFAVAGAVVGIGAALVYDVLIDDPLVSRAARSGYIEESHVVAANAREAEARRQKEAAEKALAEHRKRVSDLEDEQARLREQREQEIQDYEELRRAAGRACLLDDADIRWLRRN